MAVFPALPPHEIRAASVDTVKEWDSLAHITLVTVIDEEFGTSTDLGAAAPMDSFAKLLEYVEENAR